MLSPSTKTRFSPLACSRTSMGAHRLFFSWFQVSHCHMCSSSSTSWCIPPNHFTSAWSHHVVAQEEQAVTDVCHVMRTHATTISTWLHHRCCANIAPTLDANRVVRLCSGWVEGDGRMGVEKLVGYFDDCTGSLGAQDAPTSWRAQSHGAWHFDNLQVALRSIGLTAHDLTCLHSRGVGVLHARCFVFLSCAERMRRVS